MTYAARFAGLRFVAPRLSRCQNIGRDSGTNESAELIASSLSEISVGGAMLATPAPLALETDVILEITPPGAVRPISISGKATYHLPSGSTGLKFLYRDAGGSRRLRELVRRLRTS